MPSESESKKAYPLMEEVDGGVVVGDVGVGGGVDTVGAMDTGATVVGVGVGSGPEGAAVIGAGVGSEDGEADGDLVGAVVGTRVPVGAFVIF